MFEERKKDMMATKISEDDETPYIKPGDENSKFYSKPDESPLSHPADDIEKLKVEKPDADMEDLVKEADEIIAKEVAERQQKRDEDEKKSD